MSTHPFLARMCRYVSVGVCNQDNCVNRVYHTPGAHELAVEKFDTPYVALIVTLLVDASDPHDIAAVNTLQGRFSVSAGSSEPFVLPNHD
jgi:hypothetical protein